MPASESDTPFRPVHAVAAFLFPGLGHALGGEIVRGLHVALGVLGLFFGGLLVGGIDVIDRRENPVWFVGQALVGPLAFGADWYHQNHLKVLDPVSGVLRSAAPTEGRDPRTRQAVAGGTPPNRKSVGRMNELGTLFACIAGMMNLIAIIDAAMPGRRAPRPARAPGPARADSAPRPAGAGTPGGGP